MQDVKVTLSIIWIAVMLTYLWGDVLRLIVGDNIPGGVGELGELMIDPYPFVAAG